jgi:hypothetical protein
MKRIDPHHGLNGGRQPASDGPQHRWNAAPTRAGGEPAGHSVECPIPHKPTPGQILGQGIDLVVVAAGEGQKFRIARAPSIAPNRNREKEIGDVGRRQSAAPPARAARSLRRARWRRAPLARA